MGSAHCVAEHGDRRTARKNRWLIAWHGHAGSRHCTERRGERCAAPKTTWGSARRGNVSHRIAQKTTRGCALHGKKPQQYVGQRVAWQTPGGQRAARKPLGPCAACEPAAESSVLLKAPSFTPPPRAGPSWLAKAPNSPAPSCGFGGSVPIPGDPAAPLPGSSSPGWPWG